MPSEETSEKIIIVGFGWVGQANALALARMGFEVFYYDILAPKFHYADKYAALYKKITPIETLLKIDGPSTWYVVCIGDRVSENGYQDISLVKKAIETLRSAQGRVILRSTILPKYLHDLPFHIYLPEFLHEINAVDECLNPFFFIAGTRCEIIYPEFLKQWERQSCKVFKGTPEEASYLKYLSNIWNALRIAFVNEFGDSIASPENQQQREKIERIINFFFEEKSYLRYGRSFGGHCLPKDTRAFAAWKNETAPSPLLKALCESNKLHQQIESIHNLPQWFSIWDYATYGRGATVAFWRFWQKLNSLKTVAALRQFVKPVVNFFGVLTVANKSLPELKIKWEKLAKENPYYYANPDTKLRQNVDEFELCQSGETDYVKYVTSDPILREKIGNQDKTVLEIGSGVGRMTEFFARDFKMVYGIDISPNMLAIARKRLIALGNINLIENTGNVIPFSDGKFDLIFSCLVFRHLPSENLIQDYFKEIFRSLKPDGLAKIQLRTNTTPHFWQWFYGISLSPDQAQTIANKTGLKVIKMEIENSKNLWLWLKKRS